MDGGNLRKNSNNFFKDCGLLAIFLASNLNACKCGLFQTENRREGRREGELEGKREREREEEKEGDREEEKEGERKESDFFVFLWK